MLNSNRTRRVLWYQLNDSKAIIAYLEKMARRGWLLEKIHTCLTFRRIEPENLTFDVAYFSDASVYDPAPTEGQETYIDYCRAAGWELAAVQGPMQIFYSRLANPTPIETDEQLKLTAIRKAMRKVMVLPYALLLVSMLLSLNSSLGNFSRSPLSAVSRDSSLCLLLLVSILALVLVYFLLDHWIWCLRSQRSVERGGPCVKPSTRPRLAATGLMLMAAALLLLSFGGDLIQPDMRSAVLWALAGTSALVALLFSAFYLLKKHGRSRSVVKWGYIGIALVITLAFSGLTVKLALSGVLERAPAYVYTDSRGHDWNLYRDEMPVTLEMMGYSITEADHCSYKAYAHQSPLASYRSYEQWVYDSHSTLPGLSYSVAVIKWNWLRETCWEKLIAPSTINIHGYQLSLPDYKETDPTPWGAKAAYLKGSSYLLLYDDRIATINAEWVLSEDQVKLLRDVVIEK